MELAAVCEQHAAEFLGQPANAVTSVAFVVAGAGMLVARRRSSTRYNASTRDRQTVVFAVLASGIGVGSFIQHGPNPDWQAFAHDLPLATVMVFVAVDAVSDLTGHELPPAYWFIPSVAMVPVVAAGATASTTAQAALATAAIGLNLVRARRHPALRRPLYSALAALAAGAVIGTLSDRTSLCQANSVLPGHAIWHILAAAALWRLASAIGAREAPSSGPVRRQFHAGGVPARRGSP
jgi:hypothetical protein